MHRHLLAACAVAALATVVNPYGVAYPRQLFADYVLGARPRPDAAWNVAHLSFRSGSAQHSIPRSCFVLMAASSSVSPRCAPRAARAAARVDWMIVLVNAVTVPLFFCGAARVPLAGRLRAERARAARRRARARPGPPRVDSRATPARSTVAVFIYLAAIACWGAWARPFPQSWLGFGVGYVNPVVEAEYVARHGLGPRLYNVGDAGGYLLWRLGPEVQVMADSRSFPYLAWFDEHFALIHGRGFEGFRRAIRPTPRCGPRQAARCSTASSRRRPGARFYGPTSAVFVPSWRSCRRSIPTSRARVATIWRTPRGAPRARRSPSASATARPPKACARSSRDRSATSSAPPIANVSRHFVLDQAPPPSLGSTRVHVRSIVGVVALMAWALVVQPRLGDGATGGGSTNTTFTTSTTHHETHTRVDVPPFEAVRTRVLGALSQTAPSGEALVYDESTPTGARSEEAVALFGAAATAVENAANDTNVLAGTCAALRIDDPALVVTADVTSPAIKVDEALDHEETSVTTSTTFGPGTILIGEDQSETFFVAPGTMNINTNTHTERFFNDFFAATITHEATYQVTGHKTVGPADEDCRAPVEDCTNCVDDDEDGDVDRADFGCGLRADAAGAGLGDPKPEGKAIAKCAATIQKTGAKAFAARLKHLHKCTAAVFACLQLKPGDQACLAKAGSTCAKELGAETADEAKVGAAIGKACAGPALPLSALAGDRGLGVEREAARCAAYGVPVLATLADVATCVARQHRCNAEHALAFETPRAAALLAAVGRDPAVDAPCLPAPGTPSGGLDDLTRAKVATKCAGAIAKAGGKLATGRQKLVQKCAAAVYACVQLKPSDAACLAKARANCTKQLAKIVAPASGLEAKLGAGLAKACGTLDATELAGPTGLGFDERTAACQELTGMGSTTATDVARCLGAQHACRVRQLLELEQPRLDELLGLGQVTLP